MYGPMTDLNLEGLKALGIIGLVVICLIGLVTALCIWAEILKI